MHWNVDCNSGVSYTSDPNNKCLSYKLNAHKVFLSQDNIS